MKIISVNVGAPRVIFSEGRAIRTGIFKTPAEGRVRVGALNLAGDEQADLTVHGGPSKAVYVYPLEHYEFWRKKFPARDLSWGMFGENLTSEGLSEKDLNIGDRLCAGSVELVITQPRLPCYKLALRFGDDDMVKLFLRSRRTGFYCAVLREGEIGAGDPIHRLARDDNGVSVAEITRLYAFDRHDAAGMRRAVGAEALPESWRSYFCERLEKQVH